MTNQIALLDLNFFFHKGCQETPEIYDMISSSGDGSFGFVMWEDYKEEDFVPNLFTPYTLFKLLFKDHLMTPGWVHDFSHEDIFIMTTNENGDQVDIATKIDNESGEIILNSSHNFNGKLIIIGKPSNEELPQFYVKDISTWTEDNNQYRITIPQEEHNFIGDHIIDEIRDSKGNIVDLYSDVNSEGYNIRSNSPISGRLSMYGNVNQANFFVRVFDSSEWIASGESYYIVLPQSEVLLDLSDSIIKVKDEKNTTVNVSVNINPVTKDIRIESNVNKTIKVMAFKEDLFYSLNFTDSLWVTTTLPYEIRIPVDMHGLFTIPNKIMHHIKRISRDEFTYLPTRLQNLLDTYYTINNLWLAVEDVEDIYDSILLDPSLELPLLNLLLKTKDFVYGGATYGDTSKSYDSFMETYYNNFDSLTPLMKVIVAEMYYLHYNKTDAFKVYENIIDLMPTLYQVSDNKAYHLMVILYSYTVINKIMSRKITSDNSIDYVPDYWDNKPS